MDSIKKFNSAIKYLPVNIRTMLEEIPDEIKNGTFEIRLRAVRPVSLIGAYGTLFLKEDGKLIKTPSDCIVLKYNDISETFNRICSYSIHTFQRCINSGYIPMEYGNRAGVCGTAVCERDDIVSVKDITSVNIRISREIEGCADQILSNIDSLNSSYIIAGPPSSGKTTIIRDIARRLSSGYDGKYIKTVLIDERREISGIVNGIITNNIGVTCDVLDSYPKARAIDIAVRTLSPQIIICDEISTEEELKSIKSGVNCGVSFIVTVHTGSEEELLIRTQVEELLLNRCFKKIFLLESSSRPGNLKSIIDAGELLNEISLRRINNDSDIFNRLA